MRVVRTVPAFYPYVTGPANQAFEISNRISDRGIDSPVYTSRSSVEDEPLFDQIDNVNVRRCPDLGKFMSFKLMPSPLLDLPFEKFDIIHSHCYRGFLTETAYQVCRSKNKPFILHNHGTFLGYREIADKYEKFPYILYDKITRKRTAINADAIIVSSKQEKREAVEFGVTPEKISIIPTGIDVSEYSIFTSEETDDFTLLFVGRLSRNRNVEQAIQSLVHLPEDVKLRIVGDEAKSSHAATGGYLDELKRLVKAENIEDQVIFTGAKYDDDLKKEYARADAFVYTSVYENLGQTILEAAAAGLPVVATPVGVANELVVEDETGYLTPIGESGAVAENVKKLRRHGAQEMGRRMRNRVENRYDWETIIDKYVDIYEEVIDSTKDH